MITREKPHSTTYDLYGNPNRLVEFRVFSLNKCEMGCKGCFYNKIGNDYNDFVTMETLARNMEAEGYCLETLYLLPTEIFEDKGNYKLFDIPEFTRTVSMFNFLGLAATLEEELDHHFIETIINQCGVKIELQINLLLKRIFEENYLNHLNDTISDLKVRYGSRMVINLAINTGFDINPLEMDKVLRLSTVLSEDSIVETNFTFLFNDNISFDKKKKMLDKAFRQINAVQSFYSQSESYTKRYNERSLAHKPSFAFVSGNEIYVNPIIPFDEYVYIKADSFKLNEPTYQSFLETLAVSDFNNVLVDEKCNTCELLSTCYSKRYFTIANEFGFGCHLEML